MSFVTRTAASLVFGKPPSATAAEALRQLQKAKANADALDRDASSSSPQQTACSPLQWIMSGHRSLALPWAQGAVQLARICSISGDAPGASSAARSSVIPRRARGMAMKLPLGVDQAYVQSLLGSEIAPLMKPVLDKRGEEMASVACSTSPDEDVSTGNDIKDALRKYAGLDSAKSSNAMRGCTLSQDTMRDLARSKGD